MSHVDPLGLYDFLDRMADRQAGIPEGRSGDQYSLPAPRLPDGYSFSAPLFGLVSGNVTVDRYGRIYFGPGGGVPDVSASVCWIPTANTPSPEEASDFFNGLSANGVFGLGLTIVPGYKPAMTVGTPSLGGSTVQQVK